MKQNELAMGFGRKKNQLLERAKRIIYDNNKSLNSIEKTFLSICIIIITSFTVACSNTKATTSQLKSDTTFLEDVAEGRPATDEELSADEQVMTAAEVAEVEALAQIDTEATVAQAEAEVAQAEAEVAQAEAEVAQAEAEKAVSEANLSEEELKQNRIEAEQARKEGELARIESQKAKIESIKARKEGDKAKKEGAKARKEGEKAKIESIKARIEGDKVRRKVSQQQKLESLKERLEEKRRISDAERVALESQLEIERIKDDYPSVYVKIQPNNQLKSNNKVIMVGEVIPANVDDITKNIIEDLVKEKVIVDLNNLSYRLSTSKLIVNNKEISETVHRKLKNHLTPNITAVYYNYDVSKK